MALDTPGGTAHRFRQIVLNPKGQKDGRNGKYNQGREFDADGNPVRDIDFTDHGRPSNHPNPHKHDYLPNATGGTPMCGPTMPLQE